MATSPKKSLALDTNLLLDLAEGRDFAHEFKDDPARLINASLLPHDEQHDGIILAQSSLAKIPLLVTSDKHLLDVDQDALLLAFNDADLAPVHAAHPRRLLKALL